MRVIAAIASAFAVPKCAPARAVALAKWISSLRAVVMDPDDDLAQVITASLGALIPAAQAYSPALHIIFLGLLKIAELPIMELHSAADKPDSQTCPGTAAVRQIADYIPRT
jgi:hypothetical protein